MRAMRFFRCMSVLLFVMFVTGCWHEPPKVDVWAEVQCIIGEGLLVDLTNSEPLGARVDLTLEANGLRDKFIGIAGSTLLLTNIPVGGDGTLETCIDGACVTFPINLDCPSDGGQDDDGDDDDDGDNGDDDGDGNGVGDGNDVDDSNNDQNSNNDIDSGNNTDQDGDGNTVINNNPVIIINIDDDDDNGGSVVLPPPPPNSPCPNVLDLGTLRVSHGGITNGDPRYSGFFFINQHGELLENVLPGCWDVVKSDWHVSYQNASGAQVGSFQSTPDYTASVQLTLSGAAGISNVVTGSVFVVNTSTNVVLELHATAKVIPPG